uniref:Uncharacterized protein n=2 Tax=Alexandrium monilatum TaxID=311494 RepID=A0A7S4T332_9DINO
MPTEMRSRWSSISLQLSSADKTQVTVPSPPQTSSRASKVFSASRSRRSARQAMVASGSPAASPRPDGGDAERVQNLTQQLKVARDQLDKKSDQCDELEEKLQELEAAQQEASRGAKPSEKELQLTRQLKLTRGQLDEKSDLCDELAEQLRQLEVDLDESRGDLRNARACLSASGAELRAAAHAGAAECLGHEEEAQALCERLVWSRHEAEAAESKSEAASELHATESARLRSLLVDEEASVQALESRAAAGDARSEALDAAQAKHSADVSSLTSELQRCRAELEALQDGPSGCGAAEASDLERTLVEERSAKCSLAEAHAALESRLEEQSRVAADRLAAAEASAHQPKLEVETLRRELSESTEREAGLMKALQQEKELHDEALSMLHQQRIEGQALNVELRQELEQFSGGIEQKEDEIMNIHFEMVGLQNKLHDQMRLFSENSEELKQGREQLAEKDGRLQHALRRQEELVVQMNEATSKLQEKVAQLSHELEGSRAAYQTLEQHTQAVIGRLESEREALLMEIAHARAEADGRVDATQAANERLEAERRALLAELTEARAEASDSAVQLEHLAAASQASQREARSELDVLQRELRTAVESANTQRGLVAEHQELQRSLREEHLQAACLLGERDDTLTGMAETVEELRRVAAQCGDQATKYELAVGTLEAREAEAAWQLQEAATQLEELQQRLEAQQQREAALTDSSRQESQRTWELQERLRSTDERCDALEIRARDLERTLERSRLKERQALERAQELRTSLALLREFGREDFMHGAVPKLSEDGREPPPVAPPPPAAQHRDPVDARLGAEVSSVLISVELDLGFSTVALSVAPWQTRADFDTVVDAFLKEHRLKAVFAEALVRYLEELEAQATAFPVAAQASIAEVYSQYG